MRITALKPRHHRLVAVYLDDEPAGTLDAAIVARENLREGMELSEAEFAALQEQSGLYRAKEKGLYILEHRANSKKELVQKITRSEGSTYAQTVADDLEEIGLVDDAAYAKDYARQLITQKGYSQKAVRYALKEKGIAPEIIDRVTEELPDDEEERLRSLLQKKYPAVFALQPEEKIRRRAYAYAMRMGYSGSAVRAVLHTAYDPDENEGDRP